MPASRPTESGFSLLELAIVLAILGILLSGILVAVSQTSENNRRTQARVQLEQVMDALHGFAQANGRLPCPATDASDGRELGAGGPLATEGGDCALRSGFVPQATIGLNGPVNGDGLLLDPWSNPLRYSVSNFDGWAFTTADELPDLYPLAPGDVLFTITGSGGAGLVTDKTPAVVLSTGANGGVAPPAGTDEETNITDNASFVSRDYSEENFDDLILWMSPYILYNRLVSAGRLPREP